MTQRWMRNEMSPRRATASSKDVLLQFVDGGELAACKALAQTRRVADTRVLAHILAKRWGSVNRITHRAVDAPHAAAA